MDERNLCLSKELKFLLFSRIHYVDGIVLIPFSLFLRSYERLGKACWKERGFKGWKYKYMKYQTRNWRLDGKSVAFVESICDALRSFEIGYFPVPAWSSFLVPLLRSTNYSSYAIQLTRYGHWVHFIFHKWFHFVYHFLEANQKL